MTTNYIKGLGQNGQVSVAVATGHNAPVVAEGGFLAGEEQTFTIAAGATGSLVAMADLGKPYAFILVRCENSDNVASGTMSAQVAWVSTDTACDLWGLNGDVKWASGTLPTAANSTYAFLLTNAFGFRYIRFILSAAASGGSVVIKIRGLDGVLS